MADISKITVLNGTQYNIKDGSAISNITRSGTTFTATRRDGTTFTFTQQDNNTTYNAATQSAAGLMSADDKKKLDGIAAGATSSGGSVTSVAASGSGGISISGSPITTSGTIGIGLNLSTAINGLGEGSSPANRADYAVVQYAGGGTTTTTYHRRTLANVFKALNKDDITTALGYTPYNSTNPNGYTTNTGTVTKVSTGVGLTGGDISTTGTVKTKLRSETALTVDSAAATTTSGRVYPVAVDKTGYLAVNVPWTDNNTIYSAGTGISLSGTTFSNSGVRSIATGSSNGTISVNTNGTSADVAVKGLGSAAYTASTAYAAASHTHDDRYYTESEVNAKVADMNKEAYLTWGGKNFAGSYGPIDAAMVPNLGANRLAFINGSSVTIEYSRDGGSTWTDYGAGASANASLFGTGGSFTIGKADSTNKATANTNKYQLRVTVDTGLAPVYTALNKFVIYVSTNGSNSCTVQIQKALQSTPTTFVDHTSDVPISGWSGYNVINVSDLVTYGNTASSQYGRIRFIFKANGGNTNYNGLIVNRIMGFGGVGWTIPSNMARDGHLYSYDNAQNATFPAQITATQFNGSFHGNASTATKATQDESGNNIKSNYAASFSISDHTITLKNKNGESLGTVTVPDNNTTYTANTGIKLNGTTFQHTNAVTAGTAGTSSATSGSTLAVPYVTYDAQGHITGSGTHTHTISGFLTSSSSLDASKLTGTVPTSVLPSYVDDVLEYTAKSNFPSTGETGKIYVDTSTNLTYRWGGSAYVEISPSLAIGSTASTAAKGNHTHSVTAAGSISVQTAGTTTTVPNVTSVGSVPTTEDITCDDITAWSAGSVPTLGTAIAADDITAWSAGTNPSLTITNQTVVTGTTVSNEVMSFNTTTNGSASGWSAGTAPSLSYTARSIPNVTSVGSAPSLTYTARTVKSVKSVGSTPTLGTAITVKTGDAAYKFTGSAVSTGVPA